MNTIVVCTDFSPNAGIAVQYGVRIATDSKMKLLLCNSFQPVIGNEALITDSVNQLNQLQAILTAAQKKLTGNSEAAIPVTTLSINGSISNMADTLSADKDNFLILMGTHDKNLLDDVLAGNSVDEMIDRSDIPVLLIPPGTNMEPIRKFAFATDLEAIDRDLPAFYKLVHIARIFSADILLTHVYQEKDHSPIFQKWIAEFLTDISNKANYGHIYYKVIKSKNTETGLDELWHTTQISILVMVHRQQRFLQNFLRHSYSKKMAGRISIPLLIIPSFAE